MAALTPVPKIQFFDANGHPLAGGKLYSYSAGTTTPLVTYTDQAGTSANTNPVILDARGEASVWLGTGPYKLRLTTATDVDIWTVDDIYSEGALSMQELLSSAGSSLVGFIQSGTGATYRTVQSKLRDTVSVKDFGAVGDGVADDTAAIQAALNTGKTVYFPAASVGYKVSTIYPLNAQTLQGDGRWENGLVGTGSGPVIQFGDGTGAVRTHNIIGLKITNNGARCVYVNEAPNFHMHDCQLSATGADAIYLYRSYRATIRDSFITCSGAFTAINALDNVNGFLIDGNTITGGSLGRAIRVGQSQGVRVSNNIIESSLNGIWIAATSDSGDGQCSGVHVTNNYIEQCSTPFVFGKHTPIRGLVCTGNYVGNSVTSVIAARTAVIQHGRLQGAQITDNAFYVLNTVEDLIHIYMELADCQIEGVLYERNFVQNTPANNFQKFGTYATNMSVNDELGRDNRYDFGWLSQPAGRQEFVTPNLSANVTTATQQWFRLADAQFGGHITSVEIVNAEGTLTGCFVALGDSSGVSANVANVDISTLSYTGGRATMTLAEGRLDRRAGGYNTYKVTAGAGTGSFQIRMLYRAN